MDLGFEIRVFFLPRKVSRQIISPIAHPASNFDPRNHEFEMTKTNVQSSLQDLLTLLALIHKKNLCISKAAGELPSASFFSLPRVAPSQGQFPL